MSRKRAHPCSAIAVDTVPAVVAVPLCPPFSVPLQWLGLELWRDAGVSAENPLKINYLPQKFSASIDFEGEPKYRPLHKC